MAEAVDVAALHDPASVDRALAQAATAVRFGQADMAAIPHRTRLSRKAAGRQYVWRGRFRFFAFVRSSAL
jgi:hypothetical protein